MQNEVGIEKLQDEKNIENQYEIKEKSIEEIKEILKKQKQMIFWYKYYKRWRWK